MNDDERPNGGGGGAEGNHAGARGFAETAEGPVTSTFTDISGRPVFVLAAVGHEDAWIAVPRGVERDVAEWR